MRVLSRATVMTAILVLTGCASNGSRGSTAHTQVSRPPIHVPPSVPAPHGSLARCPTGQTSSALPVFARFTVTPDDLTAAPNGDVWVTATNDGRVLDLTPTGAVRQTFTGPNAPEGIIVTADRTLVAEQTSNRIIDLASSGAVVAFETLANHTGLAGVDGLGFDAANRALLVPNSPDGTLIVAPLSGATPAQLAQNLGRPVSATVGPDGSLYVAAESDAGLVRVPAYGGPAERVGTLSQLDEVITLGGLLYTVGASDGTVRAVDPANGDNRVLVTGAQQLQGLASLPDGRLVVVDSAARTIALVAPCA